MPETLTYKIMQAHLAEGSTTSGQEIGLRMDQTLTQDATGTLAIMEFAALGLKRVRTEVSVSYVDHNLLQTDFKNADDHRFFAVQRRPLRPLVLSAGQRHMPPASPFPFRTSGGYAFGL